MDDGGVTEDSLPESTPTPRAERAAGSVVEHATVPPTGPGSRSAKSRRRPSVADVFGDVLPDVTSDERTPESGEPLGDDWYQDNRPPHHDRG